MLLFTPVTTEALLAVDTLWLILHELFKAEILFYVDTFTEYFTVHAIFFDAEL